MNLQQVKSIIDSKDKIEESKKALLKNEIINSWLIEGLEVEESESERLIQVYDKFVPIFKREEYTNLYDAVQYLHKEMFPQIKTDGFRSVNVRVGNYVCPPHQQVPELMLKWCSSVNIIDKKEYVGRSQLADLHAEFENIHPFIDGNGRIGRMLVVLLCERFIISEIIYPSYKLYHERWSYYESLDKWRIDKKESIRELFSEIQDYHTIKKGEVK
jgi:Fic family protein